jgi:hypothetical protein
MIRFKNQITIKQYSSGDFQLKTDFGQIWELNPITHGNTPITVWWEKQHQSELRTWQKDALLKLFGDALGSATPFVVYQKGKGYSQPHDLFVAKFFDLWIVSTQDDLWITETKYGEFILNKDDSIGSILDPYIRKDLYQAVDKIKGYATTVN